jgi:hypothetical protein
VWASGHEATTSPNPSERTHLRFQSLVGVLQAQDRRGVEEPEVRVSPRRIPDTRAHPDTDQGAFSARKPRARMNPEAECGGARL